jgi:hypothetical protein
MYDLFVSNYFVRFECITSTNYWEDLMQQSREKFGEIKHKEFTFKGGLKGHERKLVFVETYKYKKGNHRFSHDVYRDVRILPMCVFVKGRYLSIWYHGERKMFTLPKGYTFVELLNFKTLIKLNETYTISINTTNLLRLFHGEIDLNKLIKQAFVLIATERMAA